MKLLKAIPEHALINIIKSEGILSAEEVADIEAYNIHALLMARENQAHPQSHNAIYATAVKTKGGEIEPEDLEAISRYGTITLIMKNSLLQKPNTTCTYFDTGLEPSEPMPANRIPNFTEFKSFDAVEEWLRNGKDLEVNFSPKSFPPILENAANTGNSGIWHKGIRYSNF